MVIKALEFHCKFFYEYQQSKIQKINFEGIFCVFTYIHFLAFFIYFKENKKQREGNLLGHVAFVVHNRGRHLRGKVVCSPFEQPMFVKETSKKTQKQKGRLFPSKTLEVEWVSSFLGFLGIDQRNLAPDLALG